MRDVLRLRRDILRSSSARSRRGLRTTSARHIVGTKRGRRSAGRPRLHAQYRRPAAPARRHARPGCCTSPKCWPGSGGLMQVASMHFKELAHAKLNDEAPAAQPQEDPGQVRAKRRESRSPSSTTSKARATPAAAIRQRALDDLDVWLEIFERNATARGATVLSAETPAEINRLVLEIAARHGGAQDHQVEVDGVGGIRARPRDRGRGTEGGRDRPRRVHPADQRLRAAVAHHRPGAAQEQGGGGRALREEARHAA